MSSVDKRATALEQAAVALLAEAKAAGLNLQELAEKAKNGIIGNASYTWVSDHEIKTEAGNAVDYLVQGVKP